MEPSLQVRPSGDVRWTVMVTVFVAPASKVIVSETVAEVVTSKMLPDVRVS